MNLQVNEIFASIQGEGRWTGLPCVFLRLQGCNLDPPCAWCDTPQAQDVTFPEYPGMDALKVLADIDLLTPRTVVVTGGEPMMQAGALRKLIGLDYHKHRWHLETNGTIKIPNPNLFDWITVSPKYRENQPLVSTNLADELKMVVASLDDLNGLEHIHVDDYLYLKHVWLQPVSNDPEMISHCIAWLLDRPNKDQLFGLSVQTHKFLEVK